ncbi:MAG: hypothetical protein LAO78_28675 [Acidobacteriia bacterium]|nr:hypothetical protein [Terriglobia bacterium]
MDENLLSYSERQRALSIWLKVLTESGRAVRDNLEPNPKRASDLERLLKHSHAHAARAIASSKVPLVRARIPASAAFKRGCDARVLRVAFGICAIAGDVRMKRVTVYQVEPFGLVGTTTEKDDLWEGFSELFETWDGIDPRPNRGLPNRINAVLADLQRWYLAFQSSSDFLTWWKQVLSQYSEERRQLSVMYADYSLTRLFGLEEEPGGFRPSLDDEYRRRLLGLTERYQASFRAVALSVAEIRCSVISLKSGRLRLPFLPEPLLPTSVADPRPLSRVRQDL